MSNDKPSHEQDKNLFLEAVGDVKRLNKKHVILEKKRPKPKPLQFVADEKAVMGELLSDPADPDLLVSEEHASWSRDGVQNTVMRRLKNGRYAIQGELDLHGYTQNEARKELIGFIHAARASSRYCVRIIHGHGLSRGDRKAILKPSVNHWLRQHSQVLAFCSARPNDGGTGAVYVLLRK